MRTATLLPGNEHAAPGGAPRHRTGHRPRSGRVAAQHRGRRAPEHRSGRCYLVGVGHRVPRLRRRSRQQLHAFARHDHASARTLRARPAPRFRHLPRLHGALGLRPLAGQAGGLGTHARPGHRASGPGARRIFIAGIRTNLAFFRDILADPEFRAGRLSTSFLDGFFARRNTPGGIAGIRARRSNPKPPRRWPSRVVASPRSNSANSSGSGWLAAARRERSDENGNTHPRPRRGHRN